MKKEGDKTPLYKKIIPFFWIYLFILGIELLKKTSLILAPNLTNILQNIISTSPLKAFASGWFLTLIFQSSGAVDTLSLTLMANSIISLITTIFIIMGTAIGTTITALIISLLTKAKKRKDFRHGFEIATSATIYNVFIITIFFLLEIVFKEISFLTNTISQFIHTPKIAFVPDLIHTITNPLINPATKFLHPIVSLILAFIILIISLRFISKSIIRAMGGEKKTKHLIGKYFKTKTRAFFIGLIITAVVFSSSITIGLLVPLAMSRLINLRKAIPFIIGAEIGTMTDLILASLIIGKTIAFSLVLAYLIMFGMGALIFTINTDPIFNTTKYISKHLLKISKKKALIYLAIFIAIPIFIILI